MSRKFEPLLSPEVLVDLFPPDPGVVCTKCGKLPFWVGVDPELGERKLFLCPHCRTRVGDRCTDCGKADYDELAIEPPDRMRYRCPACGHERLRYIGWMDRPPLYNETLNIWFALDQTPAERLAEGL
ncbi:MAG: hypothetical protein QME96_03600 [Myxococcota bacterium]|nr:hypothetical protein [Myxococcota bacterium]